MRAWVKQPFHIVKNRFWHKRLPYRGLVKNTAQLHTLFAMTNLVIVKKTVSVTGLYLAAEAQKLSLHCVHLIEVGRNIVFAAAFAGDEVEAAARNGLGRGRTTEMDDCSEFLLLPVGDRLS